MGRIKHGMAIGEHGNRHPLYAIWARMIRRCENPREAHYACYGGRGIRVCERWRKNVAAFLEDMGPRPSPAHSLDRIDVNGHYEPGNCRWATMREQQRNRRSNRMLTFRGETRCIVEWAELAGISATMLSSRLNRGWDPERALVEPRRLMKKPDSPRKSLTVDGETRTVTEWAAICGIKPKTIHFRLAAGYSPEAAVRTPLDPRVAAANDNRRRRAG